MQVKSIAECSKGSILQYVPPSLTYHLSLRPLFLSIFEWPLKTGFTVNQSLCFKIDLVLAVQTWSNSQFYSISSEICVPDMFLSQILCIVWNYVMKLNRWMQHKGRICCKQNRSVLLTQIFSFSAVLAKCHAKYPNIQHNTQVNTITSGFSVNSHTAYLPLDSPLIFTVKLHVLVIHSVSEK